MLEVVVSLFLVATILLVSLTASANVMRNRASAVTSVQGQILAGYFLDEISSLEFRDLSDDALFGPEPDESDSDRTSFDDVDDYHGFSQVTPTFRDGQSILGYDNWSVRVRINPLGISESTLRFVPDLSSQIRLIGVSVTSPQGETSTFRSMVSITPLDRPPSSSFERVRRVDVHFSDDRRLQIVVPLRNTPPPAY